MSSSREIQQDVPERVRGSERTVAIFLMSLGAACALVAVMLSVWNSIVLSEVREEQLSRTRRVYNVGTLEERIEQLEKKDGATWNHVQKAVKQSTEAK